MIVVIILLIFIILLYDFYYHYKSVTSDNYKFQNKEKIMNKIKEVKKLSTCQIGEKLKVVKLSADTELKQRFISFGIMKEAIVEILERSPAKSTIEIKVGKMRVALRAKEAQMIEVETV